MLNAIQSPDSAPLYRFFLENDFNLEQHAMFMNLTGYYEILLTGHTLSAEKFEILIRPPVRKVCVKKAQDITLENLILCVNTIKSPLLYEFDEWELENIKGFAPNLYKTLK
jgi:hypothetical protein